MTELAENVPEVEFVRGRLIDEDLQATCEDIARCAPPDWMEHYEPALSDHSRNVRGWWRRLTELATARERQGRRNSRRTNR